MLPTFSLNLSTSIPRCGGVWMLKNAFRNQLYQYTFNGTPMITFLVFFNAYEQAHQESITERACCAGFRQSGLVPNNTALIVASLEPTEKIPTPALAEASQRTTTYSKMTSRELGALARQFFDDGNQIEFGIVNFNMVARMARAGAQVQFPQKSIERLENQQASAQQL